MPAKDLRDWNVAFVVRIRAFGGGPMVLVAGQVTRQVTG